MDKAKDEAQDDGKTPYERMKDFTERIVQVPKDEVEESSKRTKRAKSKRRGHSSRS